MNIKEVMYNLGSNIEIMKVTHENAWVVLHLSNGLRVKIKSNE